MCSLNELIIFLLTGSKGKSSFVGYITTMKTVATKDLALVCLRSIPENDGAAMAPVLLIQHVQMKLILHHEFLGFSFEK